MDNNPENTNGKEDIPVDKELRLSDEQIEIIAKENTPSYSWGKAEWGNITHAIQIGAKAQLAHILSVLVGTPDGDVKNILAKYRKTP